MPRQSKGPHLWLHPARKDAQGNVTHQPTWIILDGAKRTRTGCAETEIADAQVALGNYITQRYRPPRKEQDVDKLPIADVLSIYDEDKREGVTNKRVHDAMISRLNDFWGEKALSKVSEDTCKQYVDKAGSPGGARRDLETLRAAIAHHTKKGLHHGMVIVTLPPKGKPRERWLTRSEAAALLWYCWRKREMMTITRGPNKGQVFSTKRRPLRHIARFILLGLYTGTRAEAIACASPKRAEGHSWVDLNQGVFYRLQEGRKATNKRQTPVRLPDHLLGYLRRWARPDADGKIPDFFVEWNGAPVRSVKTGFASAIEGARVDGEKIEHASPHTLRHTAATWLMQNGVDKWEAAGFLGMSEEILEKVYGHHHPNFQRNAAKGFRPRKVA